MNTDELLTVKDLAARIAVHEGTVRRWIQKGLIPVVTLPGGTRRIPRSVIEDLVTPHLLNTPRENH